MKDDRARDGEAGEAEGLKVVDRRRFTDSGDSRTDSAHASNEPLIETRPRPAPASSKPVEGGSLGNKSSGSPSKSNASEEDRSSREGSAYGEGSVDFSSFVVSLATQAFAMLGEIQHPELRQVPVSLDAARQTIDVIGMLQERTKGNLTSDEEKLITEALSSLRLAYVRKANQSSKK